MTKTKVAAQSNLNGRCQHPITAAWFRRKGTNMGQRNPPRTYRSHPCRHQVQQQSRPDRTRASARAQAAAALLTCPARWPQAHSRLGALCQHVSRNTQRKGQQLCSVAHIAPVLHAERPRRKTTTARQDPLCATLPPCAASNANAINPVTTPCSRPPTWAHAAQSAPRPRLQVNLQRTQHTNHCSPLCWVHKAHSPWTRPRCTCTSCRG